MEHRNNHRTEGMGQDENSSSVLADACLTSGIVVWHLCPLSSDAVGGWGARAQAAYRRGDGAAANSYAREAAEKRAIAVRLQSEACGKILYANNEGKGLGVWEIDLHGLHTREAVCAVEARYTSLPLPVLQHLGPRHGTPAPTKFAPL